MQTNNMKMTSGHQPGGIRIRTERRNDGPTVKKNNNEDILKRN